MRGWGIRKNGFTLIEASIVIIIIGILMVGFSTYWKSSQRIREKNRNDSAITQINSAIAKYKNKYGFYPCPAPPKAPPGDPTRGREMRFTAAADLPAGATPLNGIIYGRCYMGAGSGAGPSIDAVTGIARVPGHRVDPVTHSSPNLITVQSFPHRTDPATIPDTSVFIGTIPYVTLGLPEQYTYDAYSMKYMYAVSGSLTHNNTFDLSQNNLTTQAFNYNYTSAGQKSFATDNYSQSFIVFSSGRDRLGAYTAAGTQFTPCPSVQEIDDGYTRRENCDSDDAIFIDRAYYLGSTGIKYYGRGYNDTSATHYFDDIVSTTSGFSSSTWDGIYNTAEDIRNVNQRNVGIGVPPNDILRLDVAGRARADEFIANTICATNAVSGTTLSTPGKCLDTQVLTGRWNNAAATKKGGMNCPTGYLQKIGAGSSVTPPTGVQINYTCATPPLNVTGLPTDSCDNGKWVTGFHADGSLCCTGEICP